ncbi:hypothetical protein KFK09_004838 [Dendrobium nobile]|uniref:DUF4283 domain-containing protein n=1 Tax=Dendrobium nobile TaxID=94219 RepID=A0A8T3BZ28_DENNO|nr:hypothetical protein KFK09_004838 [Dendrobium nobile]
MAGVPPPNPWGKPTAPSTAKKAGFFNLGSDDAKDIPSSRSFKEVLEGTQSGDIFPNIKQDVFNGFPAVLLSDEEVLKLASPFQFTLVGKFGVRRPNLDAIRNFFSSLKLTGFYSVGLLDSRHVAIQLSNDLDYSRVFARRSYFILNCQMRILKWTPFFDIKEESPIVPVWISFPNLRLHFFNSKVLHALGSIFGRPLQTDQATAARTRPSVARVLVEVDISKKHPKEVWVGSKAYGYLQKVELEKVSEFCNHCKIHGHAQVDCFKLNPELKKSVVPNNRNSGGNESKQVYVPIDNSIENKSLPVNYPTTAPVVLTNNSVSLLQETNGKVENRETAKEDFVNPPEIGKGDVGNMEMLMEDRNIANVALIQSSNDISQTDPKLFILIDDMLNDMPTMSNSVAIENALLARQDLEQSKNDGEEMDNEHVEEGEFVPPSKNRYGSPYNHVFFAGDLS